MISEEKIEIVRANWLKAAQKHAFQILTPFTITVQGMPKKVFAFAPGFGSARGIIVDLISPPDFKIDQSVIDWARSEKYSYSFINYESYLSYNDEIFQEALEDWKRFD